MSFAGSFRGLGPDRTHCYSAVLVLVFSLYFIYWSRDVLDKAELSTLGFLAYVNCRIVTKIKTNNVKRALMTTETLPVIL